MAAITARPASSDSLELCTVCHEQFLDVLAPEAFLRDNRVGDDDGYWIMQIAVSRCVGCTQNMAYGEWLLSCAKYYTGCIGDGIVYADICLTVAQMSEAATANSVGAVTGAKTSVHNGNIQLCNMRCNSIVGRVGEDTLYKQAVYEVWPYIANLLTSNVANRGVNSWACCGGRLATLRNRKFVRVRRPRLVAPPPPESSVDEQIFGSGTSDVPNVKLLADAGHSGVITREDVIAVKFCPTTADRLFYANDPNNVRAAVEGRIDGVYVPFDMNDAERAELDAVTEALCNEIRNSDSIEKIASWLAFGDIKSKKWTPARAELALNSLLQRLNPEFEFKAAIKLEPMAPGKPPRMLIADGDAGAVMSALVIGTLERYFCRYHKSRTIKGKPKAKRMLEICQEAYEMREGEHRGTAHEAFMMENDGSAWDACCRAILRDATENKIIDVVFDKLWKFFLPYNWYRGARKKADTKQMMKVQCRTNKIRVDVMPKGAQYTQEENARAICRKNVSLRFDAIRRSGDRGTSILNFIVNLVCWSWVLGGNAGHRMVSPNCKCVNDIFGARRRVKIWLEGDDSLLWVTGPPMNGAELVELAARWTKLGHRPKLFIRRDGDVAEFCGWKICVNKYGLDEHTACPDVPRMLKNYGYTTAREAVEAANNGDEKAFGRIVAPAIIARAGSIATRVPTVAHWMLQVAKSMSDKYGLADENFTRDDLFRMGTEDMTELLPEWWKDDNPEKLLSVRFESFFETVQREVSNAITHDGLIAETRIAIQHGWVKNADEWFTFASALNHIGPGTPDELFRSIIPVGMM